MEVTVSYSAVAPNGENQAKAWISVVEFMSGGIEVTIQSKTPEPHKIGGTLTPADVPEVQA